jgi:uncharacterized protein GlcG (DUF336 family)
MRAMGQRKIAISVLVAAVCLASTCFAQNPQDCSKLPDYGKLKTELTNAVKQGTGANGGLGNQEWGAVVNRDGIVCAVVFTGPNRGAEWPGSRVVAAEKANTANSFSTSNFAMASGNLFSEAQPGNALYGVIGPPNPNVAFAGDPQKFGQADDPMVGKPIGGVIVFGGGLPLYDSKGELVGALGVSGDTPCADHVIAWKTRRALGLSTVPMGVAPGPSDNLILDIQNGNSPSGFGHPACKGGHPSEDIIRNLEQKEPVGPRR